MSYESVAREIKDTIVACLNLPIDPASIKDDEPLMGGRLAIGSMTAIEILIAIETRYDLKFDDTILDYSLFSSVRRVATLVSSLQESDDVTRVL